MSMPMPIPLFAMARLGKTLKEARNCLIFVALVVGGLIIGVLAILLLGERITLGW